MTKSIKQILKELGIGYRDLANNFGYKNVGSLHNSPNSKAELETGLEWFYSLIKRETREEEKEKDG